MRRREFNQPGLAQFETKPSITLDVYAYLFSGKPGRRGGDLPWPISKPFLKTPQNRSERPRIRVTRLPHGLGGQPDLSRPPPSSQAPTLAPPSRPQPMRAGSFNPIP